MCTVSRLRRLVVTALLLLFAWGRGWAAAEAEGEEQAWIALQGGPAYELLADAERVTVRIPIWLRERIAPEEVRLRLLDVALGDRHETRLYDAFTLRAIEAPGSQGSAIEVEVDLTQAAEAGAYDLLIEAAHPDQAEPQTLALQIVHPTATLRPVDKLTIERTRWALRRLTSRGAAIRGTPLVLRETSGRSQLTQITVQPLELHAETDPERVATLSFLDPPAVIPPGGSAALTYQPSGDYPLGTATGAIEVRAPELDGALTVLYEVRTRLAPWVILLVIGLGLLLGYASRTVLQNRLQLAEAQLRGLDLQESLRQSLDEHPDSIFQQATRPELDDLSEALRKRDLKVINEAISSADVALRKRLDELEMRLLEQRRQMQELDRLLATGWSLPGEVRDALQGVRDALSPVEAALSQSNAGSAAERLRSVVDDLGGRLAQPISEWTTAVSAHLALLGSGQLALPDSVKQMVQPAVAELQKLDVPDLPPQPTPEDVSKTLKGIHNLRTNLAEFYGQLGRWLQHTLDGSPAEMRLASMPVGEPQSLQDSVTSLVGEIEGATEVEQVMALLESQRLRQVTEQWAEALRAQAEWTQSGGHELYQPKSLGQDEGPGGGPEEMVYSLPTAPAPSLPMPQLWAWVPRQAEAVASAVAPFLLRVGARPRPVRTLRERTLREILTAKLAQTAVAGVGIAVVGYLLFAEGFVGTAQEVAGIFLWAFGLDVTVDAFLEAAKGVKG